MKPKGKISVNYNVDDTTKTIEQAKYQKSIHLMKSLKCMTICEEKMEMYIKVSGYFASLPGYKDSDKYSKECIQNAEKVKCEINKETYERANNYLNMAKSFKDYKLAAEEFHKISEYMDAGKLELKCNQLIIELEKKIMRKKINVSLIIIALILTIIVGVATPSVKFFVANIFETIGSYNTATYIYNDLGTYKDSDEKKIDVKKRIISGSNKGDSIIVGNCSWIILEIMDDRALLIKENEINGEKFNDSNGDITWESSTIRKYLNTKFLKDTFSEKELINIIPTLIKNNDNDVYGTSGGLDTNDYIFILSSDEIRKYKKLLPNYNNNCWLRTPGHSQDSIMFLSINGSIMDYGYDATSEEMSVIPAMWFDLTLD